MYIVVRDNLRSRPTDRPINHPLWSRQAVLRTTQRTSLPCCLAAWSSVFLLLVNLPSTTGWPSTTCAYQADGLLFELRQSFGKLAAQANGSRPPKRSDRPAQHIQLFRSWGNAADTRTSCSDIKFYTGLFTRLNLVASSRLQLVLRVVRDTDTVSGVWP